ncbi:hypothetical protein [Alloactinosynnema sp. L-07]|uniref:hypothetical protein n=1 Tax=Alloactinosynnema sp. L-07 TaxID=1653480 RepID=UPI00065F07A9|nr:hypothetical protein [Alloactinosynnema sp. L-07]CRK56826.1 hypothetical protein [Alloactinosynnema sp. L-07]
MFDAFTKNELLLSILPMLAGEDVDLESVETAFKATRGDFRAKFTAAVQAQLAQLAAPEVFIDIPEHPEQLLKVNLEKLVRPVVSGFLRSSPTKDELLSELGRIRQRQERRPAWIPRTCPAGRRLAPPSSGSADSQVPDRPVAVAALPELGEIVVLLPGAEDERPELGMMSGGIGEWESALYSVLGFVGEDQAPRTVTLDSAANEALVPEEARWWPTEPSNPALASTDPGVASELLATSATLGGLPVADHTTEAYEAVIDALTSAGDWRYSPQWLLESWIPGDDTKALTIARAAVAGWADEQRSGVIMYVYGGALHSIDGAVGTPDPLHSYLLVSTRSMDRADTVSTVHRVVWSCPGENWCHRGGCPDVEHLELAALFAPITNAGLVADQALENDEEHWVLTYQQSYGDGEGSDYGDRVLDVATSILRRAGWVDLEESTWEGGLEQALLRRDRHCLLVTYDPVTRQLQLTDGKAELELTLQLLSDDGVLVVDDGGTERIDVDAADAERWAKDLVAAADDFLQDRIDSTPDVASPIQITILGLHPHGDGTLRAPHAVHLADRQLNTILDTSGLLTIER